MLQDAGRAAPKGRGHPPDGADAAAPEASLVASLLMIAKQARALLNLKLTELDLVAGQEHLLLALGPNARGAVSELADALAVRASTVSKMLDRLEEKGLVARSPHPTDARKVRACLSPAGVEMHARVRLVLAEFERELRQALGVKLGAAQKGVDCIEEVLAARLRRLR